MKVSQDRVSIAHRVYSESQDRWCVVKNYVVYDHQLKSRMLREFINYLDRVAEEDRWIVIGLATEYLGRQTGRLHGYGSWRRAVNKQYNREDIDPREWNAMVRLKRLLDKREPY